jgi:chemotaxis protein CheX
MTEAIILPARLDVAGMGDLMTQLRQAENDGTVRIDASNVTHFGALGAQLLISMARKLRARQGTMELTGLDDRTNNQLAAMGLSPEMIAEGVT